MHLHTPFPLPAAPPPPPHSPLKNLMYLADKDARNLLQRYSAKGSRAEPLSRSDLKLLASRRPGLGAVLKHIRGEQLKLQKTRCAAVLTGGRHSGASLPGSTLHSLAQPGSCAVAALPSPAGAATHTT